jgi:hypothetical protein
MKKYPVFFVSEPTESVKEDFLNSAEFEASYELVQVTPGFKPGKVYAQPVNIMWEAKSHITNDLRPNKGKVVKLGEIPAGSYTLDQIEAIRSSFAYDAWVSDNGQYPELIKVAE